MRYGLDQYGRKVTWPRFQPMSSDLSGMRPPTLMVFGLILELWMRFAHCLRAMRRSGATSPNSSTGSS